MISDWHKKKNNLEYIKSRTKFNKDGVTLTDLVNVAEDWGFKTTAIKTGYSGDDENADLIRLKLPAIVLTTLLLFIKLLRIKFILLIHLVE